VQTALLLIAHGSRQEEANDDLRSLAVALEQRGHDIVEAAFLESAQPDLESGAARCIQRGAKRLVMVPYFLSAGVHVRRDLTAARIRLEGHFPTVDIRLAEPLGRHPLLLEIVAERVREAL
jgi:sirohydrochlorin ferrochelatase